jgi:hypothetical protein
MRTWRQSATTIACTDPRTKRLRVRELRQACGHVDASNAEETQACKETAETEQGQGLAFSLSASLAFRSLPLLSFSCQPIPSQATASNLRTNYREAISIGKLAPVIAKTPLVKVSEQVKWLHADVGSVKLPLNETPEILHCVRVDIAVRVLNRMVNDGMLILRGKPVVGLQGVAEHALPACTFLHVLVKFVLPAVRYSKGPHLAPTLNHAECDSFIFSASASNDALPARAVHVPCLTADERLVNFHFASQLRSGLILHRLTNPMQQEPSRLLGDSQVAGHLAGANAVLAISNHPHRHQPLVQRDRRLIENGSDLDGELLAAIRSLALPNTAGLQEHWFLRFAIRTGNALGPALGRKVVQSVVWIVEVNNRFGQCFRGFHVQIMA